MMDSTTGFFVVAVTLMKAAGQEISNQYPQQGSVKD